MTAQHGLERADEFFVIGAGLLQKEPIKCGTTCGVKD